MHTSILMKHDNPDHPKPPGQLKTLSLTTTESYGGVATIDINFMRENEFPTPMSLYTAHDDDGVVRAVSEEMTGGADADAVADVYDGRVADVGVSAVADAAGVAGAAGVWWSLLVLWLARPILSSETVPRRHCRCGCSGC